jgi:hypothetical protein
MISGKIGAQAIAVLEVVLGFEAANCAELENGAFAGSGYRPGPRAFIDIERRATRQAPDQEVAISHRQRSILQSEVAHHFQHQPVLIGIVHLVDRHARLSLEQRVRDQTTSLKCAFCIVGIAPGTAHRTQESLRQPRYP